ncbi:hypothetical protein [Streptococcus pseudoporcinus]|uniref:V-type H+-transporting ATPase subunit E n=1 Tax=Streptococcus pseudoporcinus TaxID=361101 RepID=A0A4U9XHC7_9STRE|nr:hypothetical protein [Streptococcus pseudoporcinus]VTS12369.1 V-type H+-transporting ATPase subunit E [Streptococcus pseudoporcinus]VUC64895.1 V-type H+-transporting ATPase subunit E [Streptococcus pseudoporcinus]VUC95391.1 V-type H+-transporting ATPase subunit E [Streptococcus pseudoporcinus]VUC95781.1 V-type H+-transporting ATPase subunit E [Streptococcus pseudoporcinus]
MSDIEELKATILEQAHQDSQREFRVAIEELEGEFESDREAMLRAKEAYRVEQLRELKSHFQVRSQENRNQEKQASLAFKQKVLRDLFAEAFQKMEAFTSEQELSFLQAVLRQFPNQKVSVQLGEKTAQKLSQQALANCKEVFPEVSFRSDLIGNESGFVLSLGQIDYNYLYRELIAALFRDESAQFSQLIFNSR